jgi:gliding motility-associated-like protein
VSKRSSFIFLCQSIGLVFFLTFFVGTSSFAQLQFVQNKGQWDSHVQYKSDFAGGAFFIEKNGYTVLMENPADREAIEERIHGHVNDSLAANRFIPASDGSVKQTSDSLVLHSHAYRVSFIGASKNADIAPEKAISTYNNYYIGNDSSKWASGCGIYQSVTYKNIYPNIDVHYYTNAGTLKYDLIIHPGGNIEDVKLKYEGADKLEVKNKELVIGTSVGDSKELYPYTYQVKTEGRETVGCKYVLKNNVLTFKVDEYDPNATMVIDPTLIFSTLTGSTTDNWGYTATPGPDGSFFAGGTSFGNGYPASPGAFQTTYHGGIGEAGYFGYDIAIIKFSADGSKRLYATYLGGRKGDEQPHSMICDGKGDLIVAGRSNSSDYPVKPDSILNQGHGGGYDIVLTEFNPTGTALIGSVKIGGTGNDGVNIASKESLAGATQINRNYGDDARSEVILDNNNNVYLASCTQSTNFPVVNTGIQTVSGGGQDGVIMKFTPTLSSVLFSTYFGGIGSDACFVLALSPITNNLYVGGGTTSPVLPGDTTNVISGSFHGGNADGFVTELASDGSAIIKTTYAGTPQDDLVYGLKMDNDGFPYIMGTTTGSWPVTPVGVYNNPGSKQFIAKLMPDLSAYIYSTIFGTNSPVPNISPVAFLVDRCENVYVSGWGGSFDVGTGYPNAGTRGLVPTANAIKSVTDGDDFYFFVLGKNASGVLFSSFFGQQGGFNDHVDGGTSRFDGNGVIYQAICANCNSAGGKGVFPTTPGVWSRNNPASGYGCNEAAVKIAMDFAGVAALIKTEIDGVPYDTTGCLPLTVNFYDTLSPAQRYFWNFGDGTPTDTTITGTDSHTFNTVGWFKVMLIAEDSLKCNIRDTAYRNIRVGTDIATLAFNYSKAGSCDSLSYQFTNNSVAVVGGFSNRGFVWDYHDGSPNDTLGIAPHLHTFPSPGSYDISLCVIDTFICNSPACVDTVIDIESNVTAKFTTPSAGCAPYSAVFTNTSIGGTGFVWDFGDGSPVSNAFSPTHIYNTPGTYVVQLVANDPNTCNKTDTTTDTIFVSGIPTAIFTYTPVVAQVNTPTQFINSSIAATHYIWNFGDGNTSTDVNPLYQFNESGTFHVCLQAINANGCIDSMCTDIVALVNPLFDVPNAFTPGSSTNNIIKVVAFGVAKMDWKIYNRWGQLVFESTSISKGWDGTFKGTLQPSDVYTYTLDIELENGKAYKRTGDITLLR